MKIAKLSSLIIPILMFSIASGKKTNNDVWQPYNFKGTEHFKYSVKATEGDSTEEGFYILDLKPAEKNEIKVHIKAQLGKSSFESTVNSDKDNIYSGLAPQLMFNPAVAPMFYTLFAPWWGMYFMGHNWEVGSGWSSTDEEGKKVSFKIESECEHAGLKGKKGVWRENDKIKGEFCIATDVALPLSLVINDEEGKSYKLVLEEYKEK